MNTLLENHKKCQLIEFCWFIKLIYAHKNNEYFLNKN